jgi:hypothetical protein
MSKGNLVRVGKKRGSSRCPRHCKLLRAQKKKPRPGRESGTTEASPQRKRKPKQGFKEPEVSNELLISVPEHLQWVTRGGGSSRSQGQYFSTSACISSLSSSTPYSSMKRCQVRLLRGYRRRSAFPRPSVILPQAPSTVRNSSSSRIR